ncbi:hypothetical protein TRVL_09717 [Trypanosoma vivax]|nr:hypothetical protein TRVL_09717 [Trypanosoma vivax]
MLLFLFLFLGALGAKADEMQAVCHFKRREGLYCRVHNCLNEEEKEEEKAKNVTCDCKGGRRNTPADCAPKFHGNIVNHTCILTAEWKTTLCEQGEKKCMEKCAEVESERIVLNLDCNCWDAEGAQNQGKKTEGVQNQGKKAEGAQNQGKKAEGAQNQGKKAEGAQNSDRPGESPGTESGIVEASPSEGNAERSAQFEKVEGGVSAVGRNSQEAAYLYPLLPFIAVMLRIN